MASADVLTDRFEPRALEDEMKTAYLDYAMSVIVGRALPDVRDGLKPVHRRVLYGMSELGLGPTRGYAKCARIVGEVIAQTVVRDGVTELIDELRMQGMQCRLLTGASDRDRELLTKSFQQDEMTFRATPADKVAQLEQLRHDNSVLMIGDGLNDMSAMAVADVSIAVTENTSTLAPASDMIIPATHVHRIGSLIRYARALRGVITAALWFTMIYNVCALTIAITGNLTPVITAIMMPVSSLLVIGISVGGAHVFARRMKWV